MCPLAVYPQDQVKATWYRTKEEELNTRPDTNWVPRDSSSPILIPRRPQTHADQRTGESSGMPLSGIMEWESKYQGIVEWEFQFQVLLSLQYVIEGFNEEVFSELLNYLLVGSCAIRPSNVVGLACAAEHYEVEELKQSCFQRLLECLTASTICGILSQLEKHLSYSAAKTMVVQSLEFVDSHAAEILCSQDFLGLSEHMVHLVMRRDMGPEVPELLKVKAAFDWGKLNTKPNQEGESVVAAEQRPVWERQASLCIENSAVFYFWSYSILHTIHPWAGHLSAR